MTEAEWLACEDPYAGLKSLRRGRVARRCVSCRCCRIRCLSRDGFCPAYRKLRLYSHACCERILGWVTDPKGHEVYKLLEDYIEGRIHGEDYRMAAWEFELVVRSRYRNKNAVTPDDGAWSALYRAVHRHWYLEGDGPSLHRWQLAVDVATAARESAGEAERIPQMVLLRDITGNPYRPVSFETEWQTSSVVALAQGIYEERAFDRMPILADALQDAGCENDDILNHCRGPGPHVRGCWVVDLVLGKG